MNVQSLLRERRLELGTYLESQMLFGKPWTDAATHVQRQHRLDHVYTGCPWTYADGPAGFSAEHPFGQEAA